MTRFFYGHLAIDDLKKHARMQLPFIVSSVLTIMMFYIVTSLSQNPQMNQILGGKYMQQILSFGILVTALFACIFLFYTNSFLMKQRKKEFGLFYVLGMSKRNIGYLMFYENTIIMVVSIVLGLFLGIVLDKLFFLIITHILSSKVVLGFYISKIGILYSILLFGVIFLILFIHSIIQIHKTNPISLLHSDQMGEKEPKTKWILTILGIVCLVSGYGMSLTVKNPLLAITYFFFAVVFVIVGTYCLFTAGSITFLKALRKRKSYYYKPDHFINISNMLYRMKQNAIGLANICILSTMVLVMLSTTSSLFVGLNDAGNRRFPKDIMIESENPYADVVKITDQFLTDNQIEIKDRLQFRSLNFTLVRNGNSFESKTKFTMQDTDNAYIFTVVPLDDYNQSMHTNETLHANEVLLCSNTKDIKKLTSFEMLGQSYQNKKTLPQFMDVSSSDPNVGKLVYIVVPSMENVNQYYQQIKQSGQQIAPVSTYIRFNLKDSDQMKQFNKGISGNGISLLVETKEQGKQELVGMYAGFLFVGIFLSILFMMAAILIMYYKQMSEGYQDQKRFDIMRKVGLDSKYLKKIINSQVLTVFFLPLIVAIMHICFAYPVINKLMKMMMLGDPKVYVLVTICVSVIFSIIYFFIYRLTSQSYYKIVRNVQ